MSGVGGARAGPIGTGSRSAWSKYGCRTSGRKTRTSRSGNLAAHNKSRVSSRRVFEGPKCRKDEDAERALPPQRSAHNHQADNMRTRHRAPWLGRVACSVINLSLLGLVLHGRTMTCRSGGAGAASGRCAPAGGVAGGEGWMAGVGVLMMVSDRGSGASQKQASKLSSRNNTRT